MLILFEVRIIRMIISGIEFSESAVFAAMQNFEACNPVLRSQARSTLQYFNETL